MNNQKNKMRINDLLRSLRNKNGKTIEQVADEMGVSRQTISNWESGKNVPDGASLMKFFKCYDPSLEDFKRLLSGDSDNKVHIERDNHDRILELYDKHPYEFFDSVGYQFFAMEAFLEEVREKVDVWDLREKSLDNKSLNDLMQEDWFNEILNIIGAKLKLSEIKNDIDFPLIMLQLGLRLKKEGYRVDYVDTEEGTFDITILSEEQRKQLTRIILEHVLMPESRMENLSPIERRYLNEIQSKYNEIKASLDGVKQELATLRTDNGFDDESVKTYTLAVGHLGKDSIIEVDTTDMGDIIYAADTLDEMEQFISRNVEAMKKFGIDNKKTFYVLMDSGALECSFDPGDGPSELSNGFKLYYINCSDD